MISRIFFVCLACTLLLGCEPAAQPPTQPDPVQPPALPADPVPAPPGQSEEIESEAGMQTPVSNVNLQVLNWEQIQEFIKAQTGKVVVVDLWATYCPPCVAEFPQLVKLHEEHADQVTCISVSLDWDGLEDSLIADSEQKVLKFLNQEKASLTNILCSTDLDTLYREKLEHASIPVVFVYNQSGELQGQFPDPKDPSEFTYEANVLPLVKKLISAP